MQQRRDERNIEIYNSHAGLIRCGFFVVNMEQILNKEYYIQKIVIISSDITDKKELKIWSDIVDRIYEFPETIFTRSQLFEYLLEVAPVKYVSKL